MIWPYMMAGATLLVALAAIAGDGLRAALAVLAAYLAGRLIDAGLPYPTDMLAFAALWVAVGGYVASRGIPISGGLLIACGLCYFFARVAGIPREPGSLPHVMSDVLAALAMLLMAGPHIAQLSRRLGLGWHLN